MMELQNRDEGPSADVLNEGARESQFFVELLHSLGYAVGRGTILLDFGCGAGASVYAHRMRGVDAFGTDVVREFDAMQSMISEPVFAVTPLSPYRLPFPDAMFDIITSDQVFEHVQDHAAAFSEISRVLKPGGVSVHIYPSRWCAYERHTYVPLAGVVRWKWWFRLWAALGIRNGFQRGMSAADTARNNAEYLASGTNYISREQMLEYATPHFREVRHVESTLLYLNRRPIIRKLSVVPGVGALYAALRANCLYLKK